ncbi:MAG TPA: Ser-Thr-rich GPI-anchored membrane family protein [Candidatus Paceibacterota bacterium]|jgi:hypothetical protein|nr:Ser-Thr-rich GPI-anchored membrane family protein [Candidatus Paceibacterota bacterium]
MKTWKILVLIALVLIGISIAAQKLLLKKNSVPISIPSVLTLQDGRQCYTYSHDATKDAPYTTHEKLDITINGNTVTGTKTGTQEGPDMTNGYNGTFVGTVKGNAIDAVYSYTIEGSKNKEEELFQTNQTGLEQLRYPLISKNGMLVPDTAKQSEILLYPRVECDPSDGAQSVHISVPAGGEKFTVGRSYTLKWTGGQNPIDIFLIDDALKSVGVSVSLVDRVYHVSNTGSYNYTFPSYLKSGMYQFEIGDATSNTFELIAK